MTDSAELDYSQRFFINRLMINDSLSSSVKEIDVWLESGADVVENGTTGTAYVEAGVFKEVQPEPTPPTNPNTSEYNQQIKVTP